MNDEKTAADYKVNLKTTGDVNCLSSNYPLTTELKVFLEYKIELFVTIMYFIFRFKVVLFFILC